MNRTRLQRTFQRSGFMLAGYLETNTLSDTERDEGIVRGQRSPE